MLDCVHFYINILQIIIESMACVQNVTQRRVASVVDDAPLGILVLHTEYDSVTNKRLGMLTEGTVLGQFTYVVDEILQRFLVLLAPLVEAIALIQYILAGHR